jgi:hypothetical protein
MSAAGRSGHFNEATSVANDPSATSNAVFRRSAAMAGLSEIADYARVGQDRNDSGNLPRERHDWYDVRMFAYKDHNCDEAKTTRTQNAKAARAEGRQAQC